jgi:RNA polymerase sigma factor (sigma-70 family)
MATTQTGTVLEYVRRLASDRLCRGSDAELLGAFVLENDQSAFTTLVKRHGGLVLAVCRRVLQNLHDAEDAFQATFILLARDAGSVRKRESLPSWLHGVAYRMAKNAKRAAARRSRREREVTAMRGPTPAEVLAWSEVQALLDEEIQRLPPAYRAAFILCCLEDRSGPEAAHILGIKEGSVRSRLTRAQALLQQALARRGVGLPALLAAVGVPAALPRPLVASTVRAATLVAAGSALPRGAISTAVTDLLRGAKITMPLTRLATATALVLTLTIGGVGLWLTALCPATTSASTAQEPDKNVAADVSLPGAMAPEERPDDTPQPKEPKGAEEKPDDARKPKAPDEATARVEVRGRVLDPEGRPVKAAKLYLGYSGYFPPRSMDKAPSPAERAASGDDGTFRFTCASSDLDDAPLEDGAEVTVIAVAAGYGPDWAAVKGKTADVTLRLVPDDVPIDGRILDEGGKPVGGAKVRVVCVTDERAKRTRWVGPMPGQPPSVSAGRDGRFRLTGLGRDREVTLAVEAADIQHRWITVLTVPPAKGAKAGREAARGLLQARFDHVALASRPIHGVVRDKATGKPLAGVRISIADGFGGVAHTDQEGRYRLPGVAKAPGYAVQARPGDGQLYFAARKDVADQPGLGALEVNFDLVGGIELRGRVTDRATGRAPRRALVEYYPLHPNAHSGKIRNFPSRGGASAAVTAPDGSYRLAGLPGPGVLCVTAAPRDSYALGLVGAKELAGLFKDHGEHGDVGALRVGRGDAADAGILQEDYSALSLINPKGGTTSLTRDIALAPARSLRGSVVGPDGKPLPGATVMGLKRTMETLYPDVLPDAGFEVRRLTPGRTRELAFRHKEKGLGAFVSIPGYRSEQLAVRLEPCGSVTGRLLGKDKKPVGGCRVQVNRYGWAGAGPSDKTDRDGRFSMKELIPGQKYTLVAFKDSVGWATEFTAEPGRERDVGDLRPAD